MISACPEMVRKQWHNWAAMQGITLCPKCLHPYFISNFYSCTCEKCGTIFHDKYQKKIQQIEYDEYLKRQSREAAIDKIVSMINSGELDRLLHKEKNTTGGINFDNSIVHCIKCDIDYPNMKTKNVSSKLAICPNCSSNKGQTHQRKLTEEEMKKIMEQFK